MKDKFYFEIGKMVGSYFKELNDVRRDMSGLSLNEISDEIK